MIGRKHFVDINVVLVIQQQVSRRAAKYTPAGHTPMKFHSSPAELTKICSMGGSVGTTKIDFQLTFSKGARRKMLT